MILFSERYSSVLSQFDIRFLSFDILLRNISRTKRLGSISFIGSYNVLFKGYTAYESSNQISLDGRIEIEFFELFKIIMETSYISTSYW